MAEQLDMVQVALMVEKLAASLAAHSAVALVTPKVVRLAECSVECSAVTKADGWGMPTAAMRAASMAARLAVPLGGSLAGSTALLRADEMVAGSVDLSVAKKADDSAVQMAVESAVMTADQTDEKKADLTVHCLVVTTAEQMAQRQAAMLAFATAD